MAKFELDIVYTPDAGFSLTAQISWQAEITAIVGASGAGKSTMLELILGLRDQKHLKGLICVNDRILFASQPRIRVPIWQRGIGWVPQNAALFPHLSVADNLRFAMHSPAEWDDTLAVLDLKRLLGRMPAHLSGGEQQRVALGRALLTGASLLFLDEPFSNLDRPRREILTHMLRRLCFDQKRHLVLISHDERDLHPLCSYQIAVDHGRILEAGPL